MVFHSSLARAAHRSGVALIAIADSVTAAMAEDADHGGALRPHLTARAASVASRDGVAIVYLLEARSINFVIVVYSE